jgi:hypothetical protein
MSVVFVSPVVVETCNASDVGQQAQRCNSRMHHAGWLQGGSQSKRQERYGTLCERDTRLQPAFCQARELRGTESTQR